MQQTPQLWPPGSERVSHAQIAPGTDVLMGGKIRQFERCASSPWGSTWLVYWRGIEEPTKFQEEPVLTVWPAGLGTP
jgi:hypothetical protein